MAYQDYPPNSEPAYPTAAPTFANDTTQAVNINGSYRENRSENYVNSSGNQVENQVEVYENKNASRANMRYWTTAGIYFVLGVIEVILGLRFIFRLFGANPASDFIRFLYDLSHGFVAPFNGIFNDQALGTHSVFEFSTLVAMLIYALIAWGLVSLCRVLFAPIYNSRQQVITTKRRR